MSACRACRRTWNGAPQQGCPECGRKGSSVATARLRGADGRDVYGQWRERETRVGFSPLPKRDGVSLGGLSGRLRVRDLGGAVSAPYKGETTPEGDLAAVAKEFMLEQPDWEE